MTSPTDTSAPSTALRISGLNKHFGNNQVLIDVQLEIRRGEVHGFVGGNGSGKSTLIKILAGIEHGDPGGHIEVAGETLDAHHTTPDRARELGLRFVHQNLGVHDDLDVAENIALGIGYPTGPGGRIRWGALREQVDVLIRDYHIPATSNTPLIQMSPAGKTMVAIARAMADIDPDTQSILVLDEPTASLPKHEVDLLLTSLRRLAEAGQTIIIVSHRLDEILTVADRVSVLRNGVIAATKDTADTDVHELADLMSGEVAAERATQLEYDAYSIGEPLLEVRDLGFGHILEGVSFTLHHAEIIGIAGLAGSGRSELLQTLFGALGGADGPKALRRTGTLQQRGEEYDPTSPQSAERQRVAFVGEERSAQSVFIDWTVRKNTTIPWVGDFFEGGRLRHRREGAEVRELIERFNVKVQSDADEMWQLSGGNQQKVIMSRWMATQPDVYLLDEPTHGVDVNARLEIHDLIRTAVHGFSTGAIVVCSDLEELAALSDRVLLLDGGRIRAEITGDDINASNLGRMVNVAGEMA